MLLIGLVHDEGGELEMERQTRGSRRFALLVLLAACSSATEQSSSTSQEIVVLPNANVNANVLGNESSAAIVYNTAIPSGNGSLVVANNTFGIAVLTPQPCPNSSPPCQINSALGWNFSPATPTYPTASWLQHFEYQNCNDTFFDAASCGQAGSCPCQNRGPRIPMSDGSIYLSSAGDPTIVATGRPGQLALASVANSNATFAVDVTVAISADSGNSFGNLIRVTDVTTNGLSTNCPGQKLDQPKIVMEGTTSHVAWVYWAAVDSLQGGLDTSVCRWHPYARRIFFPANGAPQPAPSAIDLDLNGGVSSNDKTAFGNIQPVCTGSNQDNCLGGVEQIVMVWPTLGPTSGFWPTGQCLNNSMNANTVDVVWRWAIWNATASNWYHTNSQLERDGLSPTCVISGAVGTPNGNQRLIPTMTQDTSNFYAVHVFLSHSKYWHDTGNLLDLRGTRLEHAQINLQNGGLASVFEELSPVTSVPGCITTCSCTTVHNDDECFVEQFAPSAANNHSAATMAVAWHDTRLTPHTWGDSLSQTSGGFGTSAAPTTAYPPILQDAPQGRHSNVLGFFGSWFTDEQLASSPFLPLGLLGNTPWGDYEGMAVDTFTNSFYPVWGDSRNLSLATCPTSTTQSCKSLLATTQWLP